MPVPTATAEASLYRTSGAYRSAPGRVRSRTNTNIAPAGSCYSDCIATCDYEMTSYECKKFCQQQCSGPPSPPPCNGELCITDFGQSRCCPYGSTCCYGYEYPSARSVIGCCPPGRECCGGKCCEPGHTCCAPRGFGPNNCCPPGQECCDGVCYTPGPGTSCKDGTICTQGRVSCGGRCCESGEECVGGKCCKPGPPCGGGRCCEGEQCIGNVCCPQERSTTAGCCPAGQVACRVRVFPPSGSAADFEPAPYTEERCCPPGWSCVSDTPCPQGKCAKGTCCPHGQRAKFDASSGALYCV